MATLGGFLASEPVKDFPSTPFDVLLILLIFASGRLEKVEGEQRDFGERFALAPSAGRLIQLNLSQCLVGFRRVRIF